MKKLVLASQSPRRQELLKTLNYPFIVCPAVGEEVMDEKIPASALAEELARQKATEVGEKHPDALVIGADTVVLVGENLLGKPKTEEEALSMIALLQGKTHQVITGVCVLEGGENPKSTNFSVTTSVTMRSLSEREIQAYVAQGESMDKAGAYGIQGKGAWLIKKVEGDYFNVVGLPLCPLGEVLQEYGIPLFGSEENT